MAEIKSKAEDLAEHAGDYFETQFKLAALNVTDKATGMASQSFTFAVVAILALFVLLFLGLGLSWWIGRVINNIVGGFFIVAGVYVFLIALLLLLRKSVIAPAIRNFLIARIYE
jgi:apolipoprotein N-acyltransferase